MGRLFGTDGVRGVANLELDAILAYRLGKYGARVLRKHDTANRQVLIGHDGRISADMLTAALAAGFCSEGLDVYHAGEIPTPGVAALTKQGDYVLGVVVSASHNTFEYNGIKFFNTNGLKLDDAIEDEIASFVLGETEDDQPVLQGDQLGRIYKLDRAAEQYLDFLLQEIRPSAQGLRVALDCANGATQKLADRLLQAVGCEIAARLGCDGNGVNINEDSGSTHPERLIQAVKATRADVGFAFDGDGDRIMCVNREGALINGDQILAVLALAMREKGELQDHALVVTVMSNLGIHRFAEQNQINLTTTQVGDRYVLEAMLASNYSLGGEQSGHIILADHQSTGDGLLTALALIQALSDLDFDLKDIETVISDYPQILRGVTVPNSQKAEAARDPEVLAKEQEWIDQLDGNGRIVLRASGTEPLVRVMVEAETIEQATEICDSLCAILESKYQG